MIAIYNLPQKEQHQQSETEQNQILPHKPNNQLSIFIG